MPGFSHVVPRERLELPTCGLGNRCSVLLSYQGTHTRYAGRRDGSILLFRRDHRKWEGQNLYAVLVHCLGLVERRLSMDRA